MNPGHYVPALPLGHPGPRAQAVFPSFPWGAYICWGSEGGTHLVWASGRDSGLIVPIKAAPGLCRGLYSISSCLCRDFYSSISKRITTGTHQEAFWSRRCRGRQWFTRESEMTMTKERNAVQALGRAHSSLVRKAHLPGMLLAVFRKPLLKAGRGRSLLHPHRHPFMLTLP